MFYLNNYVDHIDCTKMNIHHLEIGCVCVKIFEVCDVSYSN